MREVAMSAPKHSGGVDFGLLVVRLVLGAYVGLAGLQKLGIFAINKAQAATTQPATQAADTPPLISFQWPGFAAMGEKLSGFVNNAVLGLKPDWLPGFLATAYGYAIPFLEVLFGVLVVIGLLFRFSSTLLLLMITSFTIALATKGPGVLAPEGGGPFHSNFLFLAVLLLFMFAGPGRVSFDRIFTAKAERQAGEPGEAEEAEEPVSDRPPSM
jgi:uncharacterized membrane protein YphA (DoxX/SURF4 family)